MKTRTIIAFMLLVFMDTSCYKDLISEKSSSNTNNLKSAMPHVRIAVMSGFTYLDPSLMINCTGSGTDFRNNNLTNNDIVEFSKPILDKALTKILSEKPDLLLIPGDLTYNGEKISHEAIAGILKDISNQGIKVFVIPGNKDINNPAAKAYNGSGSAPTPTITAEEFETCYSEFGYNDTIAKDPSSLSYLAQPYNKLWILGIDSRIYPIALTGKIKPETLEWIKDWLARAKEKNITVLSLLHQSAMEDWTDMAIYGPAYVIKEHETVENALTDAGLRVVFTSHANDISMNSKGENVLFDIGTGSLSTPPFPIRIIDMDPNYMQIDTHYITTIDASIPGGEDFLVYSNRYLRENLTRLFTAMFSRAPYNLPVGDILTPGTAAYYAPHFGNALPGYYAGDEYFPPSEEELSKEWAEPYKHVLKSIYTDLSPSDLKYTVDMRKKIR